MDHDTADQNTPQSVTSPLRLRTGRAFHYFCVSTETTVAALGATIDSLMERLGVARDAASLRTEGPAVLVYTGVSGDVFRLEAGYAVAPDTRAASEAAVRYVEACLCAALLYWGGMADYSKAQVRLMEGIAAAGLAPGNVMREWCLNWDGDDSDNNVILFEHSLAG